LGPKLARRTLSRHAASVDRYLQIADTPLDLCAVELVKMHPCDSDVFLRLAGSTPKRICSTLNVGNPDEITIRRIE
jgi:hypothetical protein